MLKHVTTLLITIATLTETIAQVKFPTNSETNEIEFVKIVELDSTTKKDNFNKAKLWIVNAFRSANDVIQYENAEEGKIVGKGKIEIKSNGMGMNGTIHEKQAGTVFFTLEVSTRDGKSRIKAYDLFHEAEYSGGNLSNVKPKCGGMVMTVKTWNSIQTQTISHIDNFFLDFESSMKRNKTDEW